MMIRKHLIVQLNYWDHLNNVEFFFLQRFIDLYATIAITKHLVKADELR